jgi:hypothetical protein
MVATEGPEGNLGLTGDCLFEPAVRQMARKIVADSLGEIA